LHRLEDQRRVGGGVLRLELGQLPEIAGVGDHGGDLLERLQLVHGERLSRLARCRPAAHPALARGAGVLPIAP